VNPNKLTRLAFTVLLTGVGGLFGWYAVVDVLRLFAYYTIFPHTSPFIAPVYQAMFVLCGGIFGFAVGIALFRRIEAVGEQLQVMSVRDKLALSIGLVIGLVLSAVIALPIISLLNRFPIVAVAIALVVGVVITHFTTVAALSMKEEFRFYQTPPVDEDAAPKEKFKILDTNVIIDGRIADIARTGFVEGPIYIPGFVLEELQHIADSHDNLKRARGRRGLDTLNQMDKELKLTVRTYDRLAPTTGEVDGRLVQLAKALDGALVTNDWNLNKVAELQGVPVLNINELANALKPVVLPGEEMNVLVVKEGKEPSQGVGYLDDGTMIVVEGGSRHLGESIDVLVSSVLQTSAGKMIFAHVSDEEGYEVDRGVRAYTGGRSRRPVRRVGE
jgi:uncharacterized protein YacL